MPTATSTDQGTTNGITFHNKRVFNIRDTLIKAKVLSEFMSELGQEQTSELSNMASEINFYEGTLKKLKSDVRRLKKVRDSKVRDYIQDKISMISKSVVNMSDAGSVIYFREDF